MIKNERILLALIVLTIAAVLVSTIIGLTRLAMFMWDSEKIILKIFSIIMPVIGLCGFTLLLCIMKLNK